MTVPTLIQSLTSLGFEVSLTGEEIVVLGKPSKILNPEWLKTLLKNLKQHKPAVLVHLRETMAQSQTIPSCSTCPWCLDHPWTHYPDLPKWCGWWWDHLLADHP